MLAKEVSPDGANTIGLLLHPATDISIDVKVFPVSVLLPFVEAVVAYFRVKAPVPIVAVLNFFEGVAFIVRVGDFAMGMRVSVDVQDVSTIDGVVPEAIVNGVTMEKVSLFY